MITVLYSCVHICQDGATFCIGNLQYNRSRAVYLILKGMYVFNTKTGYKAGSGAPRGGRRLPAGGRGAVRSAARLCREAPGNYKISFSIYYSSVQSQTHPTSPVQLYQPLLAIFTRYYTIFTVNRFESNLAGSADGPLLAIFTRFIPHLQLIRDICEKLAMSSSEGLEKLAVIITVIFFVAPSLIYDRYSTVLF